MALTQPSTPKWAKHRFANLQLSRLAKREQQWLIDSALTLLARRHKPGKALGSPQQTRQYLRLRLADEKAEVFGCLFLDSRNCIVEDRVMFYGTIDSAAVYPRVVVQQALVCNAAAVVVYHNHCASVAEPSEADRHVTRRLKEALALMDIRMLDHFVVAAGESVSLAERGQV